MQEKKPKRLYFNSIELPTCNFCSAKAKYDSPTIDGCWAYTCKDCAQTKMDKNRLFIGFEFIEVIKKVCETKTKAKVK